ncbi:hypothetical protein [Candidatus Marithrix sp. Canyon 246]|uniref:hypothetical protein n=1 Tax=Candidatus Marithrix sp. Canyon 246 TaxID=1827136 RepID=UPI00084A029F|nr:hypothetical protein [Candidatus Marithrix sp. Canyon 246]
MVYNNANYCCDSIAKIAKLWLKNLLISTYYFWELAILVIFVIIVNCQMNGISKSELISSMAITTTGIAACQ